EIVECLVPVPMRPLRQVPRGAWELRRHLPAELRQLASACPPCAGVEYRAQILRELLDQGRLTGSAAAPHDTGSGRGRRPPPPKLSQLLTPVDEPHMSHTYV